MLNKLIIGALALSGVALSEDINIQPLTSDSWTISKNNDSKAVTASLDTAAGEMVYANGDWSRGYASYSLPESITLTNADSVLHLAFNMTTTSTNCCQTVTLIGDGISLTAGEGGYSSSIQMGTSATTDAGYYQMQGSGTGGTYVTPTATQADLVTANTPVAMTIDIAWNAGTSTYDATVKAGDTTIGTASLGATFTLKGIVISQDGSDSATQTVSNMTLTPEPATATLSLLALAGLAARRRRK